MVDRPILFSGPMVRALLAGTKTQTRRLFKGIEDVGGGVFHISTPGGGIYGLSEESVPKWAPDYLHIAVGDRLYVRETFSGPYEYQVEKWPPSAWFSGDPIWYWADGNPDHDDWTKPKPGMHMPRWASRLTLTVTHVRVERLQDITNEDCIAEGVPDAHNPHVPRTGPIIDEFARKHGLISHYGAEYRRIWNAVNGPASWEANPWVAAYTFTVQRGNIDQVGAADHE